MKGLGQYMVKMLCPVMGSLWRGATYAHGFPFADFAYGGVGVVTYARFCAHGHIFAEE